jgi:hypothetical protein
MNVIECLLWTAVAGFELTISSGAVLLLTSQARYLSEVLPFQSYF